ncbi:hypothetical protein C8J57DRAFT_1236963 [Mycena rebaudengoi]|nr:hypothetical protein C8J57DRAFT_1236963 [Mycena rebaudengoi]
MKWSCRRTLGAWNVGGSMDLGRLYQICDPRVVRTRGTTVTRKKWEIEAVRPRGGRTKLGEGIRRRSWRDEILHKQAVRYRKEAAADTLSLPLVPGKCSGSANHTATEPDLKSGSGLVQHKEGGGDKSASVSIELGTVTGNRATKDMGEWGRIEDVDVSDERSAGAGAKAIQN